MNYFQINHKKQKLNPKRNCKNQKLKQKINQKINQENKKFSFQILSLPSWKLFSKPKLRRRPLTLSDISKDETTIAISDCRHNRVYLFDIERHCFSEIKTPAPRNIKVFEKHIYVQSDFNDKYDQYYNYNQT